MNAYLNIVCLFATNNILLFVSADKKSQKLIIITVVR
jgi:hypothetical protein